MTSKVHLALFLLFACTVTVSPGGGGGTAIYWLYRYVPL